LIRHPGDVLRHVGDRVLEVEDLQQVAPLHRQHHPLGEMAADLVLDAVCLVLQMVDLLPAPGEVLRTALHHVLEEGQHRPRARHGRLHVLLHGPDR
jgi:hypothetical protein